MSEYDDAYLYQAMAKQHSKLNSWKNKQHWGWVKKKRCL